MTVVLNNQIIGSNDGSSYVSMPLPNGVAQPSVTLSSNVLVNYEVAGCTAGVKASSAAFYTATEYNSDYDALPNLSGLTGDAAFGANLFSGVARIYGGVGYLPAVSGNYFSTPGSAALDITGNIEIIARFQLSNYSTLANDSAIISKRGASATINYQLYIATNGTVNLAYSPDNVVVKAIGTPAIPAAANQIAWVKVTRNSTTGLFSAFYSLQQTQNVAEVIWIANGTNVGTIESMAVNTAQLEVGSYSSGAGNSLLGNVYYASVAGAIGGAAVAVFNPFSVPNYAYGWTAPTGEVWTTNVSTAYNWPDLYKVAPAQLGSAGFYTVTRPWGGVIYTSATAATSITSPNSAAFNITNDIDIRIDISHPSWSIGAAQQDFLSKWNSIGSSTGGTASWRIGITAATFQLEVYNGSTSQTKAVSHGLAAGTRAWLRAVMDVDNGSSGNTVTFYRSYDYNPETLTGTWIVLGTPQVTGTIWVVNNGTASLQINGRDAGNGYGVMSLFRAQVFNGINGTKIVDINPSIVPDLAKSWTGVLGNVMTVNIPAVADTNDPTRLVFSGQQYVYNTGVVGNYTSTPDSVVTSITGDVDFVARINLLDYSNGAFQTVASKWNTTGNQRGWLFDVNPTAGMRVVQSTTGVDLTRQFNSSANLPTTDNTIVWLRWTLDVDNGAAGSTATFYYAADTGSNTSPTVWTQLGTPIVIATALNTFDNTAPFTISSADAGATQPITGAVYAAYLYNGLGGTLVAKFDASLSGQTGYTDPVNSTPWTITRSSSGKKAVLVDRTLLVFGTDDYTVTADHPLLNVLASTSFSVLGAARTFGSQPNAYAGFIGKGGAAVTVGYSIFSLIFAQSLFLEMSDGTNTPSAAGGLTAPTDGTAWIGGGVRSVAADTVNSVSNSGFGTPVTDTTTGTMANALTFSVGRRSTGAAGYWEGEYTGGAFFRRALNTSEIAQLKSQLGAY